MKTLQSNTLKVFISYARTDENKVREIYKELVSLGADAWLDKEKLMPGQDWEREISEAARNAHVILVCLSKLSIKNEGYFQKEMRVALDIAMEKPEGQISIIPVRLEKCKVPARISKYQWVDLFDPTSKEIKPEGYNLLINSLNAVAKEKGAWFQPEKTNSFGVNTQRFGRIVKSLREDLGISPEQFSKKAGLKTDLLSMIENGEETIIKVDQLSALSHALDLTKLEQREFFSAASGLIGQATFSTSKILAHSEDPKEIFDKIKKMVSELQTPAFVTDAYSDVLLVNMPSLAFLRIKEDFFYSGAGKVDGFNMMRIIFDKDSSYPEFAGSNWEEHALLNIRFFRRMSLRYRSTEYFEKLFEALKKHEKFNMFYKKALEDSADEYQSYAIYDIHHKFYGPVRYTGTEIFLVATDYGELYLHLYLPLDTPTQSVFSRIYKKFTPACVTILDFPDEKKRNN